VSKADTSRPRQTFDMNPRILEPHLFQSHLLVINSRPPVIEDKLMFSQRAMSQTLANIVGNAARAKAIKEMEQKLEPATAEQKKLVDIVLSNKSSVTILQGPNGIGKTTHLPAMISRVLEDKLGPEVGRKVLVVHPNALVVNSIPRWMNQSEGRELFAKGSMAGRVVSYVGTAGLLPEDDNDRLVYTTDDSLSSIALVVEANPEGSQGPNIIGPGYRVVFVDEARHRSLPTEMILLRIKSIMAQRDAENPVHFVIMADTLETGIYKSFFNIEDDHSIYLQDYRDTSRVKRVYIDPVEADALPSLLEQKLEDIVSTNPAGGVGILVILPSRQNAIDAQCKYAEKYPDMNACVLINSMDTEEITRDRPKMVFSTFDSVIGLTVSDIQHLIVSGISDAEIFDPKVGHALTTQVAMSASDIDHICGRLSHGLAGTCHLLWPESTTRRLVQFRLSPLLWDDCLDYISQLFSIFDGRYPVVGSMELMVYPQRHSVILSVRKLRSLGLIRSRGIGYSLQPLGRIFTANFSYGRSKSVQLEGSLLMCIGNIDIMRINMACILTMSWRHVSPLDSEDGSISRFDCLIDDPRAAHLISELGDLWLELWCFHRCARDGIAKVLDLCPELDIDEEVLNGLMRKRQSLCEYFNVDKNSEFDWSTEDNLLSDLLRIFQWRLISFDEDNTNGQFLSTGHPVSIDEESILRGRRVSPTVICFHPRKKRGEYTANRLLHIPRKLLDSHLEDYGKSNLEDLGKSLSEGMAWPREGYFG
jgi:hypothetical protein